MSSIADSVLAHHGIDKDNELAHYGVKGQKWGVIRKRGENGRVEKAKRTVSDDHIDSRISKKRKVSEMSNAELKRLNERLQLEKTNNELQSRSGLAKIKKGTAIAGTILAVGTTITTAYNFANSPAGQAIANGVKKAWDNS